ncbi:MAG: alanine--tRNA ligase [Chlamydiae bacterium]|nr:alanine--tRNA ligase [Chlamydiota bacterium]
MSSQEIRRGFLNYFKSQSHTIVPSSPVIPHNDPTLLFTNAGMNQFKDVFLGKSKRDYTRATTTQKCIRAGGKHNDLENVGHTSRHLTFFEMLGNFSFGDYFKKEAIGFAFDVTTHVFAFDPEKIWVSVYEDDDEAFELWQKYIPVKRIVRLGEKDNFWSMGDTGPCGPCSELLYDRGPTFSKENSPLTDSGERFLEFWNLVFMQFNKNEKKELLPLPKKSIDTGSGLERVMMLKMGVDSVFLTDVLRGLIAEVENISKVKYDPFNCELAPAFNVIADHIRSLAFAIADGAIPSNVERGYILRKLIRRAFRYGKMLGLNKPFLSKILPKLTSLMGDDFEELKANESRTAEILQIEEESFIKTLSKANNLLSQIVEEAKKQKRKILGEEAFKLKDTYGFPIEEILLIAKDAHLEVDLAIFNKLEEEAKEKSKSAQNVILQKFDQNQFADFTKTHKPTTYLGQNILESPAHIIAMIVNDKFTDEIKEGEEGIIILDTTPFYAEMGGQIGDTGQITKGANLFIVNDTKSPYPGVVTHIGKLEKGKLSKQDKVLASVNKERRQNIENNHSATHLLHYALEKVLGPHVKQKGSLVDDKRLRFDFDHHKALTTAEIREVETLVNKKIRENTEVKAYEIPYDEALKQKEIKQFFGEKYSSKVRVVDMQSSKELCGGAHTSFLGNIGFFKILKEMSVAKGVRRIEAVSGLEAEKLVYQTEDLLEKTAALLKTVPAKIEETVSSMIESTASLNQKMKNLRKEHVKNLLDQVACKIEKIGSINAIFQELDLNTDELSSFADSLMQKIKSGVIVLALQVENRVQVLVKISPDLVKLNLFANDFISEISPLIKGGGGGNKELAQAGGKDPSQIKPAFEKIKDLIKKKS